MVVAYFNGEGTEHDDYLSKEAKPGASIRVRGKLAEELGLAATPFTEALFGDALRGGFPKGNLSLADKFDPNFVTLDLMFAPGKSISIEIELRGDARLLNIHQASVAAAMAYAETLVSTRITKDKKTVTVQCHGAIWIEFDHNTTRSHRDHKIHPQTHTHCSMIKYVKGPDGKLNCLESRELFAAQKSLGAIYDAEFLKLATDAGYPMLVTSNGPEIAGYSKAFLDEFSGPRTAMKAWLLQNGIAPDQATPPQWELANQATRDTKKYHNRENLIEWWKGIADALGGLPTIKMHEKPSSQGEANAEVVVVDAIGHLRRSQASMKSRHQILEQAIRLSDLTVNPTKANKVIDAMLATGELVPRNSGNRIVARKTLQEEEAIDGYYKAGLNQCEQLGKKSMATPFIADAVAKYGGELTPSQIRMIDGVLESRDAIIVVNGDAGTRKSSSLEIIKQVADEQQVRIIGLAPTTAAKDVLEEAGIQTWTVQSTGNSASNQTKHKFWSMVTPGTIVFLDESSLVGRVAMIDLLRNCKEKVARLVVCGDVKQFQSVESGAALRQMVRSAQEVQNEIQLDDMRRGKTGAIRALHEAARDDAEKAVRLLHEQGRIVAAVDPRKRCQIIAERYAALTPQEREVSLVLTGMNNDRITINTAIRNELDLPQGVTASTWNAKQISSEQKKSVATYEIGTYVTFGKAIGPFKMYETVQVTESRGLLIKVLCQDGTTANFTPRTQGSSVRDVSFRENIEISKDDLIRFGRNLNKDGINNGDVARVISIDAGNYCAQVKLVKDGRILDIDLAQKDLKLRYAYSNTGHSSQGLTAKSKVFYHVCADDPTLNANSFYTNITRSTLHVEVITDVRSHQQIAKFMRRADQAVEPDLARLQHGEHIHKPTPAAFWPKLQVFGECEYIKVRDPGSVAEIKRALTFATEKYGEQFGVTGGSIFKAKVADVITSADGKRQSNVRFDRDTERVVKRVIKEKSEKFNRSTKRNIHGNDIWRGGGRGRRSFGTKNQDGQQFNRTHFGGTVRIAVAQSRWRGLIRTENCVRSLPGRPLAYSQVFYQLRGARVGRLLQPDARSYLAGRRYNELRRTDAVSRLNLKEYMANRGQAPRLAKIPVIGLAADQLQKKVRGRLENKEPDVVPRQPRSGGMKR